MYQNIFISRKDNTVHLWDDEKGYSTFPLSKYAYKRQVGGQYRSIYGDELTKVYNFDSSDDNIFESDVPPETRVLLDTYDESDEPSKGHRLGVIDIEVDTTGGYPNNETADKAITSIALYDDAAKTCYVFILDNEGKVERQERDGGYWIPAKDWKPTDEDKVKIVIRGFETEENLLMTFMDKWQECAFTMVTGWNIDMFDMPYLYTRLKGVCGAKVAKFLSPIGTAYVNAFKKQLTIAGIAILDYLSIYKKTVVKMEPSYTLNSIGTKYVGMGKIPYKGNLNDLFKSDIDKFIEYNITDVKIVVALDKKLKFLDLVRNICHVGHVPYESFQMSSRYLDGAILLFLKKNGGFIAPNKPKDGEEQYEEQQDDDEEGFSGAYVKEPVPGKYNWVYDLDLTSMYPNIIISLNMSPETKVSKLTGVQYTDAGLVERRKKVIAEINELTPKRQAELWPTADDREDYVKMKCKEFDMELHVQKKITTYNLGQVPYSTDDFYKLIEQSNYSLSSNGVMYRLDKAGIIPTILQKWFQERKEMRKKAAECKKSGDMAGYNFYNTRQQVWKILLNSMYGVLGLPIFRFYDVDNAEGVTTTGVSIIKTTARAINLYYKKELGKDGDYVIYTDTDSCFVDAVPIIKKRFPDVDFNNDAKMTEAIMCVTTEVQFYVNSFYDIMAKKFFNLNVIRFELERQKDVFVKTTHAFDAKQEVISKTSFWLAKKRYAQWVIHKEGSLLEHPEMEVKGIDVVRTSFPAAFRKFMEAFLKKFLVNSPKEELDKDILDFKETIKDLPIFDIAKNTSCKFVSKDGAKNYTPENRKPFQHVLGTPANVKAGINYNDLLRKWELDTQYEPIHHGQKIKWVYLNSNPFGFDNIAFKGDGNDPDKMLDFINQYVDRKAMFEQELKSKIAHKNKTGIYDVMKWEFPNTSMAIADQFFG
jgi:DNA polymerase elongation subunit (family B)